MNLKPCLLFVFVVVGIFTHEIVADRPQLCLLPTQPGEFCRAYIPKYAYNSATGQCEQFIYSGCHGNENNFNFLSECEETCKNVKK